MSIPGWILDVFAAVMLLVAAVSAGQLVVARAWTRHGATDADIAGSHLLMGVAMAGMLVAGLSTLPDAAWEAIFTVMTAWFAWSLWREARGRGAGALARGHHAPHLVHSAAMLYAFAALAGPASSDSSGSAGMAGGSSSGLQTLKLPTLALVFVLALVAYTVRDLDRRACADGYFHVVGGRFPSAGPALATAGRASAGPASAGPASAGRACATGTGSGAPAQPAGGGDTAVATVTQPRATETAQASAAGTGTARPGTSAERLLLAPGVVKACRVALGVTMAFMLIIMI
jgi:hypothetical protein